MRLLVSVRSAEEAESAVVGGAALIDVKEPRHGSLGRAEDAVIEEVCRVVGRACPVSAALGEWLQDEQTIPNAALTYVKWGLAGCAGSDWRQRLREQLRRSGLPRVVLAAYADWRCAQAPSVDEVFALAQEFPGQVLLIDTCCKEANQISGRKPTLLDCLPLPAIMDLCACCRDAQVRVALAGSLGVDEIRALLPARPDWFAVRGAVCDEDNRCASVQTDRVRRLVELIGQRTE
jgi:(5-formylfuran-3-yl)methyl phosphate synthase